MPRYTEVQAREAVAASKSYSEALRRVGLRPAGGNHNVFRHWVDEVWEIDNDTPGAMGKFRVTGKNDKGEPMDSAGVWTAAYVKQDGKWKARMLTAAPKPPEQKAAAN